MDGSLKTVQLTVKAGPSEHHQSMTSDCHD